MHIEKKLEENEDEISKKESHMAALAKEKEIEKFRKALGIKKDYKAGSAFDFETQQKELQEKQAKNEERRKGLEDKLSIKEEKKKEHKRKRNHTRRSRSRERNRERRRHDSSSERSSK